MSSHHSVYAQTTLLDSEVEHLQRCLEEGQLLADLAFADIVVWAPSRFGGFVSISHLRPSSAPTLFYRDIVETAALPDWLPLVSRAYVSGEIVDSSSSVPFSKLWTNLRAVPIRVPEKFVDRPNDSRVIAVLTRHSNLSESRLPSRQELTFVDCVNLLFEMISEGSFPDHQAPRPRSQGAPRAADGLIKLDPAGKVIFASPNARSAFRRLGFRQELEGTSFEEVALGLSGNKKLARETSVATTSGHIAWSGDLESPEVAVSVRVIPLALSGARLGAVVLVRDVTQVRLRERELISKDATIREIHHRVKNNLQTVASLLRIQTRRSRSETAKAALEQATRRVAAIAVVHDTLSEGVTQSVDFDHVMDRVLILVAEVASRRTTGIKTTRDGHFGVLPSEYATPLALVLTELVTNAVEHGLQEKASGEVRVVARRSDAFLEVSVSDNGRGFGAHVPQTGLGSQIVRTFVESELGGTISWESEQSVGTKVEIAIPTRSLGRSQLGGNLGGRSFGN